MDTFLTLVIAVGGIATGIGAIWTAMLARRQTRVTERSLAEQNEHSRLTLELDLLTRLEDRFESPRFSSIRKNAAKHVIDNFLGDDNSVEVWRLNRASLEVANFFEAVGYYQRRGALQAEAVLHTFGRIAQGYWAVFEPAIQKMREEYKAPDIFEDFERLNRLVEDRNSERSFEPPTKEQLRQLIEYEATIGEEPPP